ncbi:peptidase [Rhizobium etli CNPAF512]|nr:peptidase [Rhizobium etli CNPAF512]
MFRRLDAVAETAHRFDQVDAHLFAQAADEDLDRVGVAVEILVVHVLDQFGSRDDLAHVMHEIGKQPIFVRGQLQRRAVDRRLRGFGVEPHRPADDFRGGMPGGAADQRPDARQHFLDMKRLGDVIVGAGVDAGNLVAPAVARRQDQNRHGAAGAAPFLQHGDAVHLRQADIEDNGVIGLGIAEEMAFLAVERLVDDITRLLQRVGQLPVQVDIVFDYQDAHRSAFVRFKSIMF